MIEEGIGRLQEMVLIYDMRGSPDSNPDEGGDSRKSPGPVELGVE